MIELTHHKAIFRLLGIKPEISLERIQAIQVQKRSCNLTFPEAVKEFFAIENARDLFFEYTNNDDLTGIEELGDEADSAKTYLRVAVENQGAVAFYVRLDQGANPAVYDNNDEWDENLDEIRWNMVSRGFSDWIFDQFSHRYFGGSYTDLVWSGKYKQPDATRNQSRFSG